MKKATSPHNRTCNELALMALALFAGVHFFG